MEVRLEGITKSFGDFTAVNNLNVTIEDGTLAGLLGPSGCGKSTTLYMIAGLEKPTSGRIYFGDEDVTDLPAEKRGIGLVFQNYALYPHMTVRQNIMFPLENAKVPKAEALKIAQEMADLVQIGHLMDRKPGELSGGQQQRVAIARALVNNPEVIFADEPTGALDSETAKSIMEMLKILNEQGKTIIMVTHDSDLVKYATRVVKLKDGVFNE
ncbi:MAG: ABC transporter ATP-binding protein [Turicibacter sp.]|nr:ABC transporter ATP-binding protein [Turicibacter sp.]